VKALLDEQLSVEIAQELRRRGVDVEAVTERSDLLRASDERLVALAMQEDRAVVTNNLRHFRPLAAQRLAQGKQHAGLILLPCNRARNRNATGALADAIEAVMRAHPEGIPGAEHWIGPLP
jgi:predicted nuclease of predicted toxin-antitoxin system